MSDGRLFTDYRPRCQLNPVFPPPNTDAYLDSYKYRQYLIHNADKILNAMRAEAYAAAVCAPCFADYDDAGTMLPHKNIERCDGRTCAVYGNDPNGLGLGRAYGGTGYEGDHRRFLAEKADETEYFKQNANCCATPKEDLNYYPMDPDMINNQGTGRVTIPYGGFAFAGGDPTIRHMHGGAGCTYKP